MFSIATANPKEIVFLLDTSVSMNDTDPDKLSPDCIEALIRLLSDEDKFGLVTYNDNLQLVEPLGSDKGKIIRDVNSVVYTGYTNAGIGLSKALEMFSENDAGKYIIIISDGEIMLPDNNGTNYSLQLFAQSLEKATQNNVNIYTIALGGKQNAPAVNIYGNNESQKIYEAITPNDLINVIRQIAYTDFGLQKITVSSGDLQSGKINVKWPLTNTEAIKNAKIFITSTNIVDNVATYNAEDGNIYTRKSFSLIDLYRPKNNSVDLQLSFNSLSNVNVDLLMQMEAIIRSDVQVDGNVADIKLIPVDKQNNIMVLNDAYFEGKTVNVEAEGKQIAAIVKDGAICFSLPAETTRDVSVKIHYEDLGINMIGDENTIVQIQTNDYAIGYIVISIIILGIAIAALIWIRNRNKHKKQKELQKSVSPYEYAGKLKIYITKLKEDIDIAPMEYNLYRRFSKEEISLAEILHQCGIELKLEGADKIIFSPGAQKALVLTNNSNCTILKNRELLIKNYNTMIYYNERFYITFEDEFSEAILEYKSIKPSERQ